MRERGVAIAVVFVGRAVVDGRPFAARAVELDGYEPVYVRVAVAAAWAVAAAVRVGQVRAAPAVVVVGLRAVRAVAGSGAAKAAVDGRLVGSLVVVVVANAPAILATVGRALGYAAVFVVADFVGL